MKRQENKNKKLHVKKGDMVMVTAGKDKGKKGRVLQVVTADYRAFVEGINIVSRHTKPTADTPDGGIIKKEAAVHLSNLMVIDADGNATRIGRKLDDAGKLARYSKKSGDFIK